MYGFSGLEGFYVAILYCLRLGRSRDVIHPNRHFGGPIEEKISRLEGCHVGNALIFRFGMLLCSNSLLFEAWKAWKCIDFHVWRAAV